MLRRSVTRSRTGISMPFARDDGGVSARLVRPSDLSKLLDKVALVYHLR